MQARIQVSIQVHFQLLKESVEQIWTKAIREDLSDLNLFLNL